MLSKGDRFRLFVTFVEESCCSGQCRLWAQIDLKSYDILETMVSARGVGKPGAKFVDTQSVSQNDILLAQFNTDSHLYRAQVLRQDGLFFIIHFYVSR